MTSSRVPRSHEPNAWSLALSARRDAGLPVLDLTETDPVRAGVSDLDAAHAALSAARIDGFRPDARGLPAARESIAAMYAARGVSIAPDDLVLTSGTSESYAHLLRLLCDPGDDVLVPAPGYPLLEPLAALEAVELRRYRLGWDGGWHLDLAALDRARSPRTRAVVLVQPNHPTGTFADAAEREALDAWCARHRIALVSDEVFGDCLWDRPAEPSGPEPSLLAAPRRAPVFVLHGLSKLCGLPHLKLGWIARAGAAATDPELTRGLEWIADTFLSVGAPVQAALPALLEMRHAFRTRVLERVARHRARLDRAAARAPSLSVLPARGGWSAMLRLPDAFSDEAWAMRLLELGVAVHPGHFYDVERPTTVVASLIAPPQAFDEAATRLEELLRNGC